MARAQATTDHDVIRSWIETRKGHPSVVRATEGKKSGSAGLLRVDFGPAEDSLDEISWDDFFETFDSSELAFLYQDVTAEGRKSRFHKFVGRDSVEDEDGENGSSSGSRTLSGSGKRGNTTPQASPQEEEEAEEIDDEDMEDLEDEDEEDDDFDESEDDDDDFDEDDDELDDDEDEEKEEEVKPKRKR